MSCGEMNSLSSFSKRKYLKKTPKQKAVEKIIQPEAEIYSSNELTPEVYLLDEIPEQDDEQKLEESSDLIVPKEVSSTTIPAVFKNHQMRGILNKLTKDVKFNQNKSRDGELIAALIDIGAPWWIILIVFVICILVWAITGFN